MPSERSSQEKRNEISFMRKTRDIQMISPSHTISTEGPFEDETAKARKGFGNNRTRTKISRNMICKRLDSDDVFLN
jgi:hypothetical protein